jgi:hypothetical protein
MLHRNTSNYFVTRPAKHYINQPIKERDRDRTAKFGEKNSKAGADRSGLSVLGQSGQGDFGASSCFDKLSMRNLKFDRNPYPELVEG